MNSYSLASCTVPSNSRYASRRFARKFDRLRRFLQQEPLLSQIEAICPLAGTRVIELGAGTGVLTELLAQKAISVTACDRSVQMLAQARRNLRERKIFHVQFLLADHRCIPRPAGSAEVAIAAFALDSLTYDNSPAGWRHEVDRAIAEMMRLVKGGGTVIIIGTPYGARDLPGHLERAWNFTRRLILTRWRFPSRPLARQALRLFFGNRVWLNYRSQWPKALVTLTGIWWLTTR